VIEGLPAGHDGEVAMAGVLPLAGAHPLHSSCIVEGVQHGGNDCVHAHHGSLAWT